MKNFEPANGNSIEFKVNGKDYVVQDPDPTTSLNSWMRIQPKLTGVKVMCEEGGCGCCVVTLQKPNETPKAVNSCLMPLCAADGCTFTTVEGLGNQQDGYHPIQTNVAQFGASQCGYCTPGFVMNMYSLLSEDPAPTQQKIEDSFDGNICRCTGYRSLLDAMKCFACDADPNLLAQCKDIEDIGKAPCKGSCKTNVGVRSIKVSSDATTWLKPTSMQDLVSIMQGTDSNQFKLVCGNTSSGVFKPTSFPKYLVDINFVPDLTTTFNYSTMVKFGSCITLSSIVKLLKEKTSESVTFAPLVEHILKIAGLPVRNAASWAGNMMVKHLHREFPSDVCVLMEGAGAKVNVLNADTGITTTCSVFGTNGLMSLDMSKKVLVSLEIPKLVNGSGKNHVFISYKIMPRSQNAHAYVNAAFYTEVINGKPSSEIRIVYGGIRPDFARATETENFLVGKEISDANLTSSIKLLSQELAPVQQDPVDASVSYKLNLALGLFYKFYVSLYDPSKLGPGIESAITPMQRPVSTGTQTFKPDPTTYPVSQDIPKLSGILQASGEAYYLSDRLPTKDELHCAFVTSDDGNVDIDVIDDKDASMMPGFVQIITGTNFPSGVKNTHLYPFDTSQPLLATDHVEFAGQPLAIVVAESDVQARRIAAAVKVSYKNKQKAVISIQDAIDASSFFPSAENNFKMGDPDQAIADAKHKVTGECELGQQYHFYMETQYCRAEPTEEGGFSIEAATQGQSWVQNAIAYAYSLPCNKIEVATKRVGGAYGGKSTNSLITSCAAALAAYCTRKPVRFHADLKTCMSTYGARVPYLLKYTVGCDDTGLIQGLDWTIYTNSGPTTMDNESDLGDLQSFGDSAYFCENRKYKLVACKSNIPSPTWCRSPVSLQMIAFNEVMVEHIADQLNIDPIQVKQVNLYKQGQHNLYNEQLLFCNIRDIYNNLLSEYNIAERQAAIVTYNQNNKWKKRGLAVTPIKWGVSWSWMKHTVLVSICSDDGSVIVSHGGIESGQGINTKVAQVAAYELGIPMDNVIVQRTTNITSMNSDVTGGSITSEINCKAVIGACKILKSRIQPVKDKMDPASTWKEVIAKCYEDDIDLVVSHMVTKDGGTIRYNSYGATASEVEYDVLTGEHQILKVDTIFDCGISLNPSVDIGQVEGAFVMGIGFWLMERYVRDADTGKLLIDGTWEYKPPTTKDIPINWNIQLLKDAPNPLGVLRSKASGEPPMCMAVSIPFALKQALTSSRADHGITGFFPLKFPATVETLHELVKLDPVTNFTLH
uniref:xanthine dehydrogenase/oxidase-like n=1 Tax=Ciona intestinalis TaxID=7719 RepID=UPI0002B8E0D9|nr:xanthine dehydrogenase/oxidase-like [Ciona intestinalis]|eukprot:XP_002120933.2 xanthine dehydrogenase/oxidase-like [Ciona intestinalis]